MLVLSLGFSILLRVDGKGRPIVVTHIIRAINSRPSPFPSGLRHSILTSGVAMGRGWRWLCCCCRCCGSRLVGSIRARAIIDHNDLLGETIFVKLAPIGFLAPRTLRRGGTGSTR